MTGLTDRGRLVLAFGLGIYVVAWGFGSRSLYPVATGLALAAIGARLWVTASATTGRSAAHPRGSPEHLEGATSRGRLEERRPLRHPGSALARDHRAGRPPRDRRTRLAKHGRTPWPVTSSPPSRGAVTASRRSGRSSTTRLGSHGPRLLSAANRPCSSTHGWWSSTVSSPRPEGPSIREGECSCAARQGSICTASASTSRASRCERCTGRRRRAETP